MYIAATREEWTLPPVLPAALPARGLTRGHRRERAAAGWLVTDLGADIGSPRWLRGMATFLVLGAAALALWPGFAPLQAAAVHAGDDGVAAEYRARATAPLVLGGQGTRRAAPGALTRPLAAAPERPELHLETRLAGGGGLGAALRRMGLGAADAAAAQDLVAGAVALDTLEPGTVIAARLGRRPYPGAPRPLERLALRARIDLDLEVVRGGADGGLVLIGRPIRIDDTPLRIRGRVGDSLYRSARAAGAPASAVQSYLQTLGQHIDLERGVRPDDHFDIIAAHRRAATGERRAGRLLVAGLERAGGKPIRLMRWGRDGRFYEASGVGEQRAGLAAPVPGPVSSRYGMRRHPILGYLRLHAGLDFKAGYGTPIVAVTDGQVVAAGRAGGCGIAVRLRHGGGLDTRYCHMSRMAVGAGQTVRRGQVIGYVGSTGLSTGPHLHYEMYRGGQPVDPASVSHVTRALLEGADLQRFRRTLAHLDTVEPGAALADLAQRPTAPAPAEREIDRLDRAAPTPR